ncbi:hypothetical protein CBS101457_004497 [Exobasidium rhododendri]|nr:hypothetical protein CBS101457_004497 [Exobasidium rhododendri]
MFGVASRSLTRSAISSVGIAATPCAILGARSVTNLAKKAYTAQGQASGQGRDGKAILTADGPFEVKLAMPKALGNGQGQNPEQLFALGYAACFLSALNLVAGKEKIKLPGNVKCEAHVSIGPPSEGPKPFAIAVDLIITSDAKAGEEKKTLEGAVQKAHEVCPYSNATRNNVPVSIVVQ